MPKQILFVCLLGFCAVLATAQTTSTEVLGTVTDTSGAVVPNARVTLLRVGTGEKRTAVTDGSGNYSFPLIEIGEYTVSVEVNAATDNPLVLVDEEELVSNGNFHGQPLAFALDRKSVV